MAFNVTSNYSGGVFGQYISAALKEAKSLDIYFLFRYTTEGQTFDIF